MENGFNICSFNGKLLYRLIKDHFFQDLTKLNRDPAKVIYMSGNALESCLQTDNCVQIKPWTSDDLDDTTLLDLLPFLEFVAQSRPNDIRPVLASCKGRDIPFQRNLLSVLKSTKGQIYEPCNCLQL
ncbi:hypothetical protein SOVF_116830 [Spinacia oleracea]|nr:hypothetical protein SOVF_116830 [Spinacia oleracea]